MFFGNLRGAPEGAQWRSIISRRQMDSRGDAQIDRRERPLGNFPRRKKRFRNSPTFFCSNSRLTSSANFDFAETAESKIAPEAPFLNMEAKYRALVEQIPAVVFMAYLDKGIGEAYVSPQIETALGFSQSEWLEDPVRWYQQIHPDDKMRWSVEAAEMFLSGKPLRSVLPRHGA